MSVKRPSRVRNPQGQGSRLRADLIAAADAILARTGDVEGLSLRAVAREVGIATPSIYLHFPDKATLVRAVLDARFAELAEAVSSAVLKETEPAAQLRAGCLTYCRFATEHPNAYGVLFGRRPSTQEMPLTPRPPLPPTLPGPPSCPTAVGEGEPQAGAMNCAPTESGPVGAQFIAPMPIAPARGEGSSGAAAFNLLVDSVAACIRAGIAPDADPFRVATNVWTALHGIVSLRSATPSFPWPELDRQVDDALAGLVGVRHNPPAAEG